MTESKHVEPLSSADWQLRYEEGRTGWDRGGASPALQRWMTAGVLSAPMRVLVPGCGRGYEVETLVHGGFSVTAIDFAPSAVESLQQRLSRNHDRLHLICGDLFSYETDVLFDAVYEQTCMCAIDPQRWIDYERKLHNWLRPGGLFCAQFMQSEQFDKPPFHCELAAMKELFIAERWCWNDEAVSFPHPMGMLELSCLLVRRGN